MKKLAAVIAIGAGMFGTASVSAHHSFAAEFDATADIELTGVVTSIRWTNPHAIFFIDIETKDGKYENWAIALGSPSSLSRRGWKRNTLNIGDEVHVTGWQARDRSLKANAGFVEIVDGPVLYEDESGPSGPGDNYDGEADGEGN